MHVCVFWFAENAEAELLAQSWPAPTFHRFHSNHPDQLANSSPCESHRRWRVSSLSKQCVWILIFKGVYWWATVPKRTKRNGQEVLSTSPNWSLKPRLLPHQDMMHFQPETLYLAIHLLNRSLCRLKVATANLQLLGMVCLFIAAKKEECLLPEVRRNSLPPPSFLTGSRPMSGRLSLSFWRLKQEKENGFQILKNSFPSVAQLKTRLHLFFLATFLARRPSRGTMLFLFSCVQLSRAFLQELFSISSGSVLPTSFTLEGCLNISQF